MNKIKLTLEFLLLVEDQANFDQFGSVGNLLPISSTHHHQRNPSIILTVTQI